MLLLGLGAMQANAQTISGGIKADANMSNFLLSDLSGTDSNMGFGASLGGFLKLDMSKHIALQPEMLFHFQNSTTKIAAIEHDLQYWGMEIPVYLLGQWNTVSDSRFYAGIGPYLGIGFDAKYKEPEVDLYDTEAFQRWDFGVKTMLGYEFAGGFQLNASYKVGFINALDSGNGTMLPQMVTVGIGYRF